jgi:hypothetical protein
MNVTPVAITKYDVKTNAAEGGFFSDMLVNCSGDAQIVIYSDMKIKFSGKLDCGSLVGKMDLDSMMKSGIAEQEVKMNAYPEFGRLTRQQNPVNLSDGPQFSPPRPLLLGPLFQNVSEYNNYTYGEASQVTMIVPGTGQTMTDTGNFNIRVLQTQTSVAQFTNVIHWQTTAGGFNTLAQATPRGNFFAFQKWDWYFSTNPIAVVKMVIESDPMDFPFGSEQLRKLARVFVGNLKTEFTVREHSNP